MDGRHFDRIARSWSTATGRRDALRAIATAWLAAAALSSGRTRASAQESQEPAPCGTDEDCIAGLDACTGAICLDGACQLFVADCMPGNVCCGNGSCCPEMDPIVCFADTDCPLESDDPCHAARCESGQCAVVLTDCAPGSACCGNGACCPVEADGCVADADCGEATGMCRQMRCLDGLCVPGPVSCPPGAICRDDRCVPFGVGSF